MSRENTSLVIFFISVLITLAFWGVIGFVAYHFISRAW